MGRPKRKIAKRPKSELQKILQEAYNKNKYTEDQKRQLELGVAEGVDITYYINPNLSSRQMKEIRIGLELDLDVTSYNTVGNMQLMCAIRHCLDIGLDYTKILDVPTALREEVMYGLYVGIDLTPYLYVNSSNILRQIRLCLQQGLDVNKIIGLDTVMVEPTRQVLSREYQRKKWAKKFNYKPIGKEELIRLYRSYVYSKQYDEDQLNVMNICVEGGFDVRFLANKDFSAGQMKVIYKGLRDGVDITLYNKVGYSAMKMEVILNALNLGFPIEKYVTDDIDEEKLNQIVSLIALFCDVDYILAKDFTAEQLEEIIKGSWQVNTRIYTNPKLTAEQMYTIRVGLANNINVSYYNKAEYCVELMSMIRECLFVYGEPCVKKYLNKGYTKEQLLPIMLGLYKGFKVEVFANKQYSAELMQKVVDLMQYKTSIRLYLEQPSDKSLVYRVKYAEKHYM